MSTEIEAILQEQLKREREVIRAMQAREARWLTPVGYFFWRKPWRSRMLRRSPRKYHAKLRVSVFNFVQWLRYAHDCSDPAIGCSCSGGYRFPNPKTSGGAKAAQP